MKIEKHTLGIGDRFAHQGRAQLQALLKGVTWGSTCTRFGREHFKFRQAWSIIVARFMTDLYSTASDRFPKRAVGSLMGLGSAAGLTAGMIFPIFCGFMLDKFSAAGNATGGCED